MNVLLDRSLLESWLKYRHCAVGANRRSKQEKVTNTHKGKQL